MFDRLTLQGVYAFYTGFQLYCYGTAQDPSLGVLPTLIRIPRFTYYNQCFLFSETPTVRSPFVISVKVQRKGVSVRAPGFKA